MKKLTIDEMKKVQGGKVTARSCMYAGGATTVLAIAQQWYAAVAVWGTAAAAGCFDK